MTGTHNSGWLPPFCSKIPLCSTLAHRCYSKLQASGRWSPSYCKTWPKVSQVSAGLIADVVVIKL